MNIKEDHFAKVLNFLEQPIPWVLFIRTYNAVQLWQALKDGLEIRKINQPIFGFDQSLTAEATLLV